MYAQPSFVYGTPAYGGIPVRTTGTTIASPAPLPPAQTTVVRSGTSVFQPFQPAAVPVTTGFGSYYANYQPNQQPNQQQPFATRSYAANPYGAYPYANSTASYYGQQQQQQQSQQQPTSSRGQGYNRGYYYDDYIHDRHSPRRSYAAFKDARVPQYDGDIIYRRPIERDEDFVLPRRSPRSDYATSSSANNNTSSVSQPPPQPAAQPSGSVTIEVVEAKDLPTSILDKTDPYVIVKVAGNEFRTKHKDDAGKSARWNETFTVEGIRSGVEGTIEVRDKDAIKDDTIATANFFVENGDRWYSLKPKGQVRLNVKGAY